MFTGAGDRVSTGYTLTAFTCLLWFCMEYDRTFSPQFLLAISITLPFGLAMSLTVTGTGLYLIFAFLWKKVDRCVFVEGFLGPTRGEGVAS